MELVLHVGLQKTATTTLQVHVLPKANLYLGRRELLGNRRRDGDLNRMFLNWQRGAAVDLGPWVDEVCGVLSGVGPGPVIISHENLVRWEEAGRGYLPVAERFSVRWSAPRRGVHPLVPFLEGHVLPAWSRVGQVRVLLTLRNQTDWLASLYAQRSHKIVGASQVDFEEQVRRIIGEDDPILDFASLVASLSGVVGRDRMHVLLMEDMDDHSYWDELGRLIGVDLSDVVADRPVANRRSGAVDEWGLRPAQRGHLRAGVFGRRPTPGAPSKWTLKAFAHPLPLARALLRRRGRVIRVGEGLRGEVRAHCGESNDRLAKLLDRDLAALGY